MNRPEPIELENNLGPDAVTGEINRVPWMAYDVDEMDIYIAEKDKENAELKAKLENVQATAYAESVDAGMENRKLKRALWLTRAERASDRARIFYFSDLDMILDIDGYSYDKTKSSNCKKDTAKNWRITWLKVERKCLAKAEEYK